MIVEESVVNYEYGWVRVYRSIQNKGWYMDSEYVHLWIHLIMEASHKGREYMWNGSIITLGSGQFITGRKKLSQQTGINESKVERALNLFESEQQIEQQKTSTSRLISILNYCSYQKLEQQYEQQVNIERTADEQRVNTKQELNTLNKVDTELLERNFEGFWKFYKKGSKKASRDRFMKLSQKDMDLIRTHLPAYFRANPEVKYRKDAERYLSNRLWENGDFEVIGKKTELPKDWWNSELTKEQWALLTPELRLEKQNNDLRKKMGI